MEKKIPVKTLYLLLVIGIGLIGLGIGSTYALFTTSAEISNPISLNSNLSFNDEIIETIEVTVPAGETVSSTLNVTNSSNSTLNYAVWYLDGGQDIDVGTNSGTPTGSLVSGSSTSVVVDIRNNGSNNVTITLGISSSSDSVVLGNNMTIVPNAIIQAITPLSDFTYYLGSEYPTVNSLTYYHIADEFPNYMVNEGLCSIQLEENEVLLVRYIGDSTTVSIPDTYVVDGITYNVTVLSYAYERNGYATGIFYNNEYISKVFLGDNIKLIEGNFDAFYDYDGEFGNPGEYYDNSIITENSARFLFFYCTNLLSVSSIPSLVTNMEFTFQGCTSLVTAPEIPNSVTNMLGTFEYCVSLVTAPKMPSSLTNMSWTFSNCTSLVTAPKIPSSVTEMYRTFNSCTSLVGTVTINSINVSDARYAFSDTNKTITALVPAGSTTYNTFSSASLPSNVTLSTFNAG